jgi:hypothetical protein
MKSKLLVVGLTLAGCASPAVRDEAPVVTAEESKPLVVSPDVRETLEAAAVTHGSFARRVLYTWASEAGAARIRAEKKLLLPTDGEGSFVQQIDALAASGTPTGEIAQLLASHPSLSTRRYAWTRPFATRVPLSDRSYGDVLIGVVLKPNAIVAHFDSQTFRFSDLDGNEVPLGHVLADPSRLAAVYHVATSPENGTPFREFVLCNESMIAEWSMHTPELARVLDADLRAVRALSTLALPNEPASEGWDHSGSRVEDLFTAAIAFDTPRHRPTKTNLDALALLLDEAARDTGAPLVVTPTAMFAVTSPRPPPVPPLPPGFGHKIEKKYYCD